MSEFREALRLLVSEIDSDEDVRSELASDYCVECKGIGTYKHVRSCAYHAAKALLARGEPEIDISKPLPCPFCGKQPSSQWNASGDDGYYAIDCCNAFAHAGDEESAIKEWNRRFEPAAADPIPLILHCPSCHTQHIDEPDERTPGWSNPPHRSHLCHQCGTIWRPADVPTVGVREIKTKGKADTSLPAAAEKAREASAQPISTAPKSGKPILLFVSMKGFGGKDASHWSTGSYSFDPCVIDGKLMGCEEGFKCYDDQCIPLNQEVFTHWQDLPSPPAATGE